MYKEAIRLIIGGVALCACACSTGNKVENDARVMLERAEALAGQQRYAEAVSVIDSIDSLYVGAVNVRREAMHLRPEIMMRYLDHEQSVTDSLLAVNTIAGDSLRKLVEFVQNPLEGYYVGAVEKNASHDVRTVPGLHARVSPQFSFYMVASSDRPVKSTSVGLRAAGEEATTREVPYDSERNDRSGRCETITFTEAECDTLAQFLLKHEMQPMTIVVYGDREYSMPLSDSQRESILTLYRWVKAIQNDKLLRIEKEKISRQTEVARNQAARTVRDEE